jgi:hypothetical protein
MALDIYLDLSGKLFGNKLFVTQQNRAGMGYRALQENDVIVLLAGGSCPFILRPTGENFIFIGPTYVHGVMYGEAWQNGAPEDQLKTFVLV